MKEHLRELEITLKDNELNIQNYSARSEDVSELVAYLQEVGISTSEKQFSLCG